MYVTPSQQTIRLSVAIAAARVRTHAVVRARCIQRTAAYPAAAVPAAARCAIDNVHVKHRARRHAAATRHVQAKCHAFTPPHKKRRRARGNAPPPCARTRARDENAGYIARAAARDQIENMTITTHAQRSPLPP